MIIVALFTIERTSVIKLRTAVESHMTSGKSQSLLSDSKRADVRARLSTSAWIVSLPETVREEVFARLILRSFDAGETIYAQGHAPTGLFGVISGQFQTVGTARDGQQAFLSITRKNEWSGFIGMLDDHPYPFSTIASVPTEIAFLPKAAAEEIFFKSPSRIRLLAMPLAATLRFAFTFLIETNGRAPQRVVAQRLLDLSRCIYVAGDKHNASIERLSQEDMAAATYLTRPTVNKILKDFDKEGLIKVGYGRVEIADFDALYAIAADSAAGAAATKSTKELKPADVAWAENGEDWSSYREAIVGEWLSRFSGTMREALLDKIVWRKFDAGEVIYKKGEKAQGLYAIAMGQAKVIGTASDGGDVLISLAHPGEWTSFLPIIDALPQPFSMVSSRSSVVAMLPRAAVDTLIGEDVTGLRLLFVPLTGMLRYLYEYLIETNQRAPLRLVAQRLYDLARCTFHPSTCPRDFVDNLSQHDLAMATGLSRPTVNRTIKELAAAGLIKIGYRKISIIDPAALVRFARDQAS
jgi:CRP/FNR family transcriptional regulator, cyclic AMP receptor protein